jgi:hypothetical protein
MVGVCNGNVVYFRWVRKLIANRILLKLILDLKEATILRRSFRLNCVELSRKDVLHESSWTSGSTTCEQIFNDLIFSKAVYQSLTFNDTGKNRRHFLSGEVITQVFLTACVVDWRACRVHSPSLFSALVIYTNTNTSPNFIKGHFMSSALTLNYWCNFIFISRQTAVFALYNIT